MCVCVCVCMRHQFVTLGRCWRSGRSKKEGTNKTDKNFNPLFPPPPSIGLVLRFFFFPQTMQHHHNHHHQPPISFATSWPQTLNPKSSSMIRCVNGARYFFFGKAGRSALSAPPSVPERSQSGGPAPISL